VAARFERANDVDCNDGSVRRRRQTIRLPRTEGRAITGFDPSVVTITFAARATIRDGITVTIPVGGTNYRPDTCAEINANSETDIDTKTNSNSNANPDACSVSEGHTHVDSKHDALRGRRPAARRPDH
jgi:hypothetical protein